MKIRIPRTIDDLIIIICYISLFFTVTNLIPLSVSFSVLVFFIPLFFKRMKAIKKIQITLLILYAYFIVSIIIYDSKALVNYGFYRRDGNFFITFFPLLILPSIGIDFKIEKNINYFIGFVSGVYLLALICTFLGIHPFGLFYLESGYINHFLFVAHNAAGGYLGVILSILVGYFLCAKSQKKKIIYGVYCIIIFTSLWTTNSRGSIVGIILALIFYKFKDIKLGIGRYKYHIDSFFLITAIITNVIFVELVSSGLLSDFIVNIFGNSNRSGTIFIRIYDIWPHALYLFKESILFGCGYGSFNDYPYKIKSFIKHFFAINNSENIVYGDGHAHNSYLHVLAETGIIGLFLILKLLKNIRSEILDINNKSLSIGLYIALITNVVSSFTEHRLFTPSQMLPFVLILSFALSEKNSKLGKKKYFL